MALGKLDSYMSRVKLEHFHVPYTKIRSKWVKDRNKRPETINTLWHKLQKYIFLNLFSQVKEIKAKINKWDLIKLKDFCTAKETIYETKDNLLKGRRFSDMTDSYLKYVNSSYNSTSNKTTHLTKWTEDLNYRHFPIEAIKQTHEKILSIINHQKCKSKLRASQNDCHQKGHK